MTFATTQRLLLGLAVLMMLAPTFMLASGRLGGPPMFEGDTRKETSCRTCDGMGKVKGETCPTCRGRGFADYIFPGDNRPIQLVGTVQGPGSKPLVGAKIDITEVGVKADAIPMLTNEAGQFGFKFPPGSYHMSFSAPGTTLKLERDIKVEADRDPIPVRGEETLHKIEETYTLN
jgi:hypothetical protein